jgi:PHD/YefM family antitoxin component YafN of YafNO toxin-antitoxin module
VRDVDLHVLRRGRRRALAPEVVDEPVDRHSLVRVEKQECEQSTLLPAAEWEWMALADDLERTKDAEIHRDHQRS